MACIVLSFVLFATCASGYTNIDDEALSMFQTKRQPGDGVPLTANDDPHAAIQEALRDSNSPGPTQVQNDAEGLNILSAKLDGPAPDKPADWLMNTPIETFVSHCTASVYGLGGGLQARLTQAFADFYRDFNRKFVAIAGIVKGALEATDQVVIYRRNDECVLTVSGTDDLWDAGQDINVQKIDACGTKVHEGMYKEAERLSQALLVQNKTMLNYFMGPKCQKRYATGHSLGGASIEFMAICQQPLMDVELDGLFSFGAPGVSEDPIPVDRELTMPTYRYWNTDSSLTPGIGMDNFDMIPWILEGLHGLGHPKMRSIEIEHVGNQTYVKHERTPDQPGATEEPTGRMGLPRVTLHMFDVYENGLASVYGA